MRARRAFDALRQADPVDRTGLAASVDRAAAAALRERIAEQPHGMGPSAPRARGFRRTVLPGSIVIAAVLVGLSLWLAFGRAGDGGTGRDVASGSGGTVLPPTLTTASGGVVDPERAQEAPGAAWLAAQVEFAEVVVWGEIVAVEPPGGLGGGIQDGVPLGSGTAPAVYSIYVIAPHEVWKGDVARNEPVSIHVVGGTPALGTGSALAALPGLRMGDQVVMLATRRPAYGDELGGELWLLYGARSVFRADEEGTFRRLEPVGDDPSGNLGPLSWLRRAFDR